MTKTYFYAAKTTCGDCHWRTCAERIFHRLRRLEDNPHLIHLKNGDSDRQEEQIEQPTSSDLMVLYAANDSELDGLINQYEQFESQRSILLLSGEDSVDVGKCHKLRPRFIADVETDMENLAAVLNKMRLTPG